MFFQLHLGCVVTHWATDLCRVRGDKDGWLSVVLVIDCSTRQLLGWHLSRISRASMASPSLWQALIARYGRWARSENPSCYARTIARSSPDVTTSTWFKAVA